MSDEGKDKLPQILHICEDGKKEDVAEKVSLGFKYCCWCGERYADAELMNRIKAAVKGVGKL